LGSLTAAQILAELISLARRSAGSADDFWNQAANEMVAHTLEMMMASGKIPSLKLAKQIIESAPRSLASRRATSLGKPHRSLGI
jgi:uncharacterized protein YjgD (DUF1641 family)